jgi:prepilin-type N-terminal cleavage/methylation domain-containing protein
MKMCCHKNNNGYTLIEILIAIVISLILIMAASATYVAQSRSYVAQESVSEVNTQSKISHDLIAGEIKSAGFGTPTDMNINPVNGLTTIVTPVDNTTSSDVLTIVGGFRMIGTMWPFGTGPGIACPATIPLGSNIVTITYSGTERPNTTDKRFISIDGIEFKTVQAVTGNAITLDSALSLEFPLVDTDGNGTCDTGRPIYLVEDSTFCVDGNQTLRRIRRNAGTANCTAIASSDNDAIAEHIEDLQFAYAVDANSDGQVDDLNGDSAITDADFINGAAVADFSTIKSIRINILARTDKADPNYALLGMPPAVVENRNHAQVADNFRRRWWQSIIRIRNQ